MKKFAQKQPRPICSSRGTVFRTPETPSRRAPRAPRASQEYENRFRGTKKWPRLRSRYEITSKGWWLVPLICPKKFKIVSQFFERTVDLDT